MNSQVHISLASLLSKLKATGMSLEKKTSSVQQGAHSGYHFGFDDNLLEYRDYAPGDDLRYLDWKMYARSKKYFIRHGFRRARQKVFIWLDNSDSMKSPQIKYDMSRVTSLALAYLFWRQGDTVFFYYDYDEKKKKTEPVKIKNVNQLLQIDAYLSENGQKKKSRSGRTDLLNSLHATTGRVAHGNKLILVTDLFIELPLFEELLKKIRVLRYHLSLLHFNSAKEINSIFEQKRFDRLVDIETADTLSYSRIKDPAIIWEKALKKRIDLILAYHSRYYHCLSEDGPVKILGGFKEL